MKLTLRIFLLLSITVLMSGCKLAVIVVEGGEVASTGSGTCVAGSICIVDVTDPGFSETFTAVPDTGWYFQKWNSGDGFFCGGSTDLQCRLSFRGHEDSKEVENIVASNEMFYIMPVFKQFPDMITIDGKQWYQPYFFAGLSWEDINAVCSAAKCSGVLNGYDLTGWSWASVEDVNALLNYYLNTGGEPFANCFDGSKMLGPGPDACVEIDACMGPDFCPTWATAFFRDGWQPFLDEWQRERYSYVLGWMSPPPKSHVRYAGGIRDNTHEQGVPFDVAFTNGNHISRPYREDVGGWFYRTP